MPSVSEWVVSSVATAVVFTGLAGFLAFRPISEDVVDRASARLAEEGRGWAKLSADGRDLTLTGTAPEPGDPRLAAEAADRVFGVRTVTEDPTVLPLSDPWVWKAVLSGRSVRVSGAVPSEAVRASLASALAGAAKGRDVADSTTLARGAPRDFGATAPKAVAVLADLVEGSVAFGPAGWVIEGRLADRTAWKKLVDRTNRRDLGFLPAEVKLVEPSPVPYDLHLTLANGRLAATGYVPDAATRETLDRTVKGAGFVAESTVETAPGAPAGFSDAVGFAASLLGEMTEARIALDPDGVSIAGRPIDRAAWHRVRDRLSANPPKGLRPKDVSLVEPPAVPYRLSVAAEAGRVVVAGHLPDAAAQTELVAVVGDRNGPLDLSAVEIAAGAPDGRAAAIAAVRPLFARASAPRVDFVGRRASIGGVVTSREIAGQIAAAVRAALPPGWELADGGLDVAPPPEQVSAEDCLARLRAVQATEKVRFAVGSADLDPESLVIVDRLAYAAQSCLAARITIEGHTDTTGDADANRILSERRAAAVAEQLIADGIAPQRLTAVGFGETRPIADESTEDGRRQNRRIDFVVEGEGTP
jgi:OOP family OmpA-OmpF porin